jgi:RHH-type proline utilization regulon transcriptional repressor/proline dehydrogenase/delta 1-pyrroline-5-carboxylate dehydrogenase
VQPGSYSHLTEFFGPVLAVMRFEKLSEAVALVNQTGFGLTSGLESLDEREWEYWREHIHAGNLYINRVTTGAIVLRQPFGGRGKSVFGAGMKAGGPNYVAQFMEFSDAPLGRKSSKPANPSLVALCGGLLARRNPDAERIITAIVSCESAQREEFGREHDHFKLVGQDNVRRYQPFDNVCVRVHPGDSTFEVFVRACAAHLAGCRVTVSIPPAAPESPGTPASGTARPDGAPGTAPAQLQSPAALLEELTESWAGAIEFIEQTDAQLAAGIRGGQTERVRYAAPDRVPLEVLRAGGEAGGCVLGTPVSGEGRLEMLWYLREQSISTDYHRYGNLGVRANEARAEVL